MDMLMISTGVMILYYFITAFFFLALLRNFIVTRNIQESILYAIVMIPFVLRLLRLK